MDVILFRLTLALYFVATIHALFHFVSQKEGMAKVASLSLMAGFVTHSLSILSRGIIGGYFPVSNFFEALSFFSWALVLLYLVIQIRSPIPVLGAFVIPLVFVFLLYSINFRQALNPLPDALNSFWLVIHVLGAFAGYAGLVMSFAVAIMYLLQDRALKHRSGNILRRLPSLSTLGKLSSLSLSVGFPGLTLAILSGAAWALSTWGSRWLLDPKIIMSFVLWILYGVMIYLRMVKGVRGKPAALVAIAGFVVILITFIGLTILADLGIFPSVHLFL